MSGLIDILKGFALPVLGAGIITGLVAIVQAGASLGQLILASFAGLTLMITAIICASLYPFQRHHGNDDAGDDAEEYLEPLRQPGPAEKTLVTDLRQRRMLLRPRGLTDTRRDQLARKVVRRTVRDRIGREAPQRGRHAAPPRAPRALDRPRDAAEAPTVTIPAVPPAVAYTPTEPVPVLLAAAVKPDTAYPDWPTGQFAALIDKTGDGSGAA